MSCLSSLTAPDQEQAEEQIFERLSQAVCECVVTYADALVACMQSSELAKLSTAKRALINDTVCTVLVNLDEAGARSVTCLTLAPCNCPQTKRTQKISFNVSGHYLLADIKFHQLHESMGAVQIEKAHYQRAILKGQSNNGRVKPHRSVGMFKHAFETIAAARRVYSKGNV